MVCLESPEVPPAPASLRRADGRSVYQRHGGVKYATRMQLSWEEKLVAQASARGAPAMRREEAARALLEAVRIEPGDATGDGNTGDGGSGNRAATIPGEVEQAAYLGAAIQYLVRTHGGMAMTVLAPKTGGRLGAGTAVVVSWSITDSLVLGDGADVVEEMQ